MLTLYVVKGETIVNNKIVHSHASHANYMSTFIHMENISLSSFPSYSLIEGELKAFDNNCASLNFSTNLNSFRNSITLSTIEHPDKNLNITNCHNVRESYHLCEMAAGGLDFIVCIRIEDQMKEGKFEVAVNLNFWTCDYQNFGMSAVCTQSEYFFGENVMLFTYQAKNNIVVVVVSLILVICGIVGLVIFCLLSYLIRKRYRNHQMTEMTELIDE